jgi:hypothetical protein
MSYRLLFSLIVMSAIGGAAQAQTLAPPPPAAGPKDCPPGVSSQNQNSDRTLSDKLASSQGVLCPPAGMDPEIRHPPQGGGTIKVIPPPGSPGGDQSVQPK